MPDAYILETTHHGDNQQLKALANQFPASHSARMVRVRLKFRSRRYTSLYGFIERVLCQKGLIPAVRRAVTQLLLRGPRLDLEKGDFLFVKTPPCEWPAALLVAGEQVNTVFLGEPQRVARGIFRYCVSTPSTPCPNAEIQLEVMPTLMLRATRAERRQVMLAGAKPAKDKLRWCLLFGGDTEGYDFSEPRLQALVDSMITLARAHDIVWDISTSPRSTRAFEARLLDMQSRHPDLVHQLCLWHTGTRIPLLDLLAAADLCFVSEESVAMLSDALNLGLPVVSVRPELQQVAVPIITPFIDYHEHKKHLRRASIEALEHFSPADVQALRPVSECWSVSLHRQLGRESHLVPQ